MTIKDVLLSLVMAVVFWGCIWFVDVTKNAPQDMIDGVGHAIETIEDMNVEQARDIEFLRYIETLEESEA